jgi:nucleotide-binding universal stress UspA family protein
MSYRPEGSHWNKMQRILVATDGSPASADALAMAIDLAAEHGSELVVAHVVPIFDVAPPPAIDAIGPGFLHAPTASDHELLRDAAAQAGAQGVVATTALHAGPPAEQIVACSDTIDADLVVVGSRGHGVVASALLGSVSLRVLRMSRRPVLIVHGPHLPARAATHHKESSHAL